MKLLLKININNNLLFCLFLFQKSLKKYTKNSKLYNQISQK